jgi:hypothetical protein
MSGSRYPRAPAGGAAMQRVAWLAGRTVQHPEHEGGGGADLDQHGHEQGQQERDEALQHIIRGAGDLTLQGGGGRAQLSAQLSEAGAQLGT